MTKEKKYIFMVVFQMMTENPWQVDSIEDFLCLKCPECNFDTQEEDIFQDHAMGNHPLSSALFGKMCIKEDLKNPILMELEEKPDIRENVKDNNEVENETNLLIYQKKSDVKEELSEDT